MRVFILEDDRSRIYQLLGVLPMDADVCIATSAQAAIGCLGGNYDLMFLDHDLGGRVYVDSGEPNTGYQVARHIADNGVECGAIFVHTLNPAGAKNMIGVLPHAKHVPFPKLIEMISAELLRGL